MQLTMITESKIRWRARGVNNNLNHYLAVQLIATYKATCWCAETSPITDMRNPFSYMIHLSALLRKVSRSTQFGEAPKLFCHLDMGSIFSYMICYLRGLLCAIFTCSKASRSTSHLFPSPPPSILKLEHNVLNTVSTSDQCYHVWPYTTNVTMCDQCYHVWPMWPCLTNLTMHDKCDQYLTNLTMFDQFGHMWLVNMCGNSDHVCKNFIHLDQIYLVHCIADLNNSDITGLCPYW